MSKERLEEIQKDVNYAYRRDGSINTKAVTMHIEHYEHLYEQAERVQELEEKFKERENELIQILTNRYKYITQLENTEIILSEKIKHYREGIEKAMREMETLERYGNESAIAAYSALSKALEGEE